MHFGKFSLLTIVGAAVWCTVLAKLGEKVGQGLDHNKPLDAAQLVDSVKHQSHLVIGVVLLVCILYFVGMKLTAQKKEAPAGAEES
jgi:membrane protein DedA with SNARE-associated domain